MLCESKKVLHLGFNIGNSSRHKVNINLWLKLLRISAILARTHSGFLMTSVIHSHANLSRIDTVMVVNDVKSEHWRESAWENRSTSSILPLSVVNSVANHECAKGTVMIDHDNLEEFRDPQAYDLQDEGYYEDYPLTEQWARSLGGPLLDLACGTGRMALRMAELGYQVTGVDITPEMLE